MERNAILKLAESYDSFYLYEEAVILRNINRLKADFPGVSFLYSAKCNPYPKVLECVLAQGFGIDAASAAECVMGQRAGLEPNQILYSAPGKTLADIKAALPIATVIADSAGEVGRIQQAAAELGITVDIGLRVNPDFSYGTDSGAASKFGIDEAQIYAKLPEWKQLPNIRIVGIHTHLKSQELSVEVLKSYYQKMFRLAVSMREVFGILKFLNLGSGMGIPMRETEQPFDTAALGQEAQRLMTAFREKLPETRVCIETGRYVSGTAGTYAARVVDKKISYGKTFVLLNNTLNGFARPSIVAMMQHFMGDGPIAGWEPIYTGNHTVQIIPLVETRERETVTVAGNLCTGTDVVLADAELPRMEVGDVVAIPNAGAYAAVITPMQFASLKRPAQLFLRTDGTVVDTDF